jgi:cytochrome c oxidase subunit II
MPFAVRRIRLATLVTSLAALVVVPAALAGNGGFLPGEPHSPNAHRVHDAFIFVSIFTGVIFVAVEGALIVFIFKYRRGKRARTAEGPQIHGATRLEIIWTVVPVLFLAAIGSFVFYKLPGIADAPKAAAADETKIGVQGAQFYWQFTYPNGATSIDELHLPVGRVAELTIRSEDVAHSWWIPQLGGKTDAIPGKVNHTWYEPGKTGTFVGQCAEFCGLFHERMLARVVVTSDADYRTFVGAGAAKALGKAEWQGVCAKCHGMQGQGDYGPAISSNPTLTQRPSLEDVIRNGRGKMPPVGNNWSRAQLRALEAYVKASVYKGAAGGG